VRRLASFLAAVLCFLALASCQPKQSASLHVSPALESLVPADTVVVLGFNLSALRDTAIYQKLITRVPLPPLEEFAKQTGLDPRKDLSEFLVCSNGKTTLLLARGKFRVADLEVRFKSHGVTPENYKGHALFGDQPAVVTFIDDSTAALGTIAAIHSLIDQLSAGRGLPPELRDLLRTLPAGDQVYAALTGGVENLNLPLPRGTAFAQWQEALAIALARIRGFAPEALVVSLGVDTFAGDPISFFKLASEDFTAYGKLLGALRLPTLFVFEGGYAVAEVGVNAVNVLTGFEGG